MKLLKRIFGLLKKKRVIAIVAVVIVALVIWQRSRSNNADDYEMTFPTRDSIIEYVTETGNVISSNASAIFPTTNGIVVDMYVSNGDTVYAGDRLLTVKSVANEQEKATAWSNYLLAQSALESARSTEYSMQASLFSTWDAYRAKYDDDQFDQESDPLRNEPEFQIPQKQWLAAESAYKNQQNVITQKQVDLSAKYLAYQATQDSTVTTPIDGTVQNISAVEGQMVTAFSALSTAEPVLMVVTDSKTTIKVDINETDYPDIKLNQKALIEVDALGNSKLDGSVIRIDKIGTNTQGVITYSVYIKLDDENDNVWPGMTVTVDIEVARKDDTLVVPASAVKPYQGGKAVRILDEFGEIEYVPVEIGAVGNKFVEIVSGIDESTKVITALKNEQIEPKSSGLFGG